jgi:hypothetical protein
MKKIMMILAAAVAVLALGGCSGAGGEEHVVVDTTIHADTTVEHDTNKPHHETTQEPKGDTVIVIVDEPDNGDNADDARDEPVGSALGSIDIQGLDDGYTIRGYSSYGNDVKLLFLNGEYLYQRIDENGKVTEEFHGFYELENGAIKIYFGDDDGGGYAIDTHNGFLEVGYFYDITGVQDDITVMEICRLD